MIPDNKTKGKRNNTYIIRLSAYWVGFQGTAVRRGPLEDLTVILG